MKILLLLLISFGLKAQEVCPAPNVSGFTSGVFSFVPLHQSYPWSPATVFLDMDGHTVNNPSWSNGNTIVCAPADLTPAQMTEVYNRVKEDYWAFTLNITTDSTVFLAADPLRRMRVIITPTSGWRPGVGGISYTGSFTWNDGTPCFVFTDRLGNNPAYIAEIASHEAGHTLGLSHQTLWSDSCTLVQHYNPGFGNWGPIMGTVFGKTQTTWSEGPTAWGCTVNQDNVHVLLNQNGITWRDRTSENIPLPQGTTTRTLNIQQYRIDSIRLHPSAPSFITVTLTSGGNTDVRARINGQEFDGPELSVSFTSTLSNGNTYLEVWGADNQYSPSNYGSFGQVQMTIHSTPLTTTPVYLPTQTSPTRDPFFRYDSENIYIRASRYAEWALLNSIGQVIKKGTYKPGSNIIPLPHSKGLYILKTEFSNHKIIK